MDKNIEDIGEIKVQIEYEKIVDEYAEKCCDKVKANARKQGLVKRGRYIEGWTTKVEERSEYSGGGYRVTVHNATDYQLTHLLENGHAITNKRGGTGWASAHPHINPAYRSVRNRFIKAMENVELKITD